MTTLWLDRGVTLEERRHRRTCSIMGSVLGTMFDLFTAHLRANPPPLHRQGTTASPSFRKGCISIAVLPRIIRVRVLAGCHDLYGQDPGAGGGETISPGLRSILALTRSNQLT